MGRGGDPVQSHPGNTEGIALLLWLRTLLKHMLNHPDRLTPIFQALADPTRRAIVERLSVGPASIGQLAEPMPMSLAAVLQHVPVLEQARLITSRKEGRVRICRIDALALQVLADWLSQRRRQWDGLFDRLEEVLDADDASATSPKGSEP